MTFESIFASSADVDPELNKIFSRKLKTKKIKNNEIIPDIEAIDEELEEQQGRSKTKKGKKDIETEKRTIFIGNLNTDCKKEELLKIFKSYGKIESVRFRNIVPEDIAKPKKYAFITKQQHPNKKSINAFIRFEVEDSAKNAAKEVNGMEYKGRHLRVDIATQSKVHDNKRSIFLGALAFDVTDEAVYDHFSSCGEIDNVRIIRDNKTGVGKGFGYVQFKTPDTLDLALKLDASKMGERKIRVSRAVKKLKEKKTEPRDSKPDAKHRTANKFQKFSDTKSKENTPGLSRLGKVKHAKRNEEKEKNGTEVKVNKKVEPKREETKTKKSFNMKDVRISRRKKNEVQRKKIKKKHVGTNNKSARRFNI